MDSISSDFYSTDTYSMDPSVGVLSGRPHGGMVILWKKSIAKICTINVSEDRIMGNTIGSVFLLNIYLPYDNGNNMD